MNSLEIKKLNIIQKVDFFVKKFTSAHFHFLEKIWLQLSVLQF